MGCCACSLCPQCRHSGTWRKAVEDLEAAVMNALCPPRSLPCCCASRRLLCHLLLRVRDRAALHQPQLRPPVPQGLHPCLAQGGRGLPHVQNPPAASATAAQGARLPLQAEQQQECATAAAAGCSSSSSLCPRRRSNRAGTRAGKPGQLSSGSSRGARRTRATACAAASFAATRS